MPELNNTKCKLLAFICASQNVQFRIRNIFKIIYIYRSLQNLVHFNLIKFCWIKVQIKEWLLTRSLWTLFYRKTRVSLVFIQRKSDRRTSFAWVTPSNHSNQLSFGDCISFPVRPRATICTNAFHLLHKWQKQNRN